MRSYRKKRERKGIALSRKRHCRASDRAGAAGRCPRKACSTSRHGSFPARSGAAASSAASAKATAPRRSAAHAAAGRLFPRGSADRRRALPIAADSRSRRLGWCEVPDDRNYNRPVKMPYGASHERMRRADDLYDVCIVLDWNIRPRRRGRGSAIFFHLARPGFTPTQGCVAVTRARDGAAAAASQRPQPRLHPALTAAVARRQRAQPQRVEADEAGGVLLVVGAAVVLEGDQRVRVERLRRLRPVTMTLPL